MKKYDVFHKTVRGASHIGRGTPCEDASTSFASVQENEKYYIAAVADGHGDPACVRSGAGTQKAVDIALDCLRIFAEAVLHPDTELDSIKEDLFLARKREQHMKQLTDTILSRWSQAIYADLINNPLTDAELQAVGNSAADYYYWLKAADSNLFEEGNPQTCASKKLEHFYGTTLMAALLVDDMLILLHQGDGRCDVFYQDGSVDQPIPWDDRCQGNVTTSLCDADAAVSVRTCVIDLSEKPILACYLGSDGVEDSFRNMEGTHVFYRKLSCKLIAHGLPNFLNYLEQTLPEFSTEGSRDDISVAGIVDLDALSSHTAEFQEIAEAYDRKEKIYVLQYKQEEYRKRLNEDMPRKLDILRRQLDALFNELTDLQTKKEQCENTLHRLRQEYTAFESDTEKLKQEQDDAFPKFAIAEACRNIINIPQYHPADAVQFEKKPQETQEYIAKQEFLLQQIATLQKNVDKAQQEYQAYKSKYKQAQEALRAIETALEELSAREESDRKDEDNG